MERVLLFVGVLICALALFSGCESEQDNQSYSSMHIRVDWRADSEHQGYYIPSDERHHGDRDHPVYRYTPSWRDDPDHHGYYIPRDNNQHGDDHHPVYNGNHHGDGQNDQPNHNDVDNRGNGYQLRSQDDGEQAILRYCAQHKLPVHITRIEQLTDQPQAGTTAPSVKRYKVIDATAGIAKVVNYNSITGALALE